MLNKFIQIQLTCKDEKEADKITKTLLEQELAVCIKKMPVKSEFTWKGKINKDQEILLLIDTKASRFKEIERTLEEIHSYDTFVLAAVPITRLSGRASEWMDQELQ